MDDVTFGRSGLYGDAWRLHVAMTAASSVAILGRSLMSMSALFLLSFIRLHRVVSSLQMKLDIFCELLFFFMLPYFFC